VAVHIHPLDIPPKFYKPLGQVIAGWNLTETLLASIIWHIHGITDPKQGRVFTYRPTAAEKLKMFAVSIIGFVDDAAMQRELTALKNRAYQMNDKRNLLAHGLWGRLRKDKDWKLFSVKDSDAATHLLKRKIMTVSDVAAIAQEIRALNSDLKQFMARNRIPPP